MRIYQLAPKSAEDDIGDDKQKLKYRGMRLIPFEAEDMIVKRVDGYYVLSERTKKNLGGPYGTREEAVKRLQQVEYFKRKKNS